MPQDRLRLMVYRSFITCDDPAGVFDCKTIRKAKIDSKRMEGKVENVKSQKNLVTSSQKEERAETSCNGSIDDLARPAASVQLKELHKGTQKIRKVVNSLPKGSFHRQSEDVAEDLFKGALSLQESLQTLGKIQGASKLMVNSKKKPKDKSGGEPDRKRLQQSYSERFIDDRYVTEFQKPRLSSDGSSRDCYQELREVIMESFARQNMLPKSLLEERACPGRKLDSFPDTASASSSQSSMFNSHDFTSSDSSSSHVQPEKSKGSNLIAKLMGLDDGISRPVQSIPQKQSENSSILSNKRYVFDLDLPSARNPSYIVQKAKPEQRKLGKIIEIMHFKGLMKGNSFDEPKQRRHPFNVSEFAEDAPPIVLIQHRSYSGLEKKFPYIYTSSCGRRSSDTEEMLKLWKINGGAPSETLYSQRVPKNSMARRKGPADSSAANRVSQESSTRDSSEAGARQRFKESKKQERSSSTRSKASGAVSSNLQKQDVIEKRVDKYQRAALNLNEGAERNQTVDLNSKRALVSEPNKPGKINSKRVNYSRESSVSKNQVLQQISTASSPSSRSRSTKMHPSAANRKKIMKSDMVSDKKSPIIIENIEDKNVDIGVNLKFEIEDYATETRINREQLSSDEEGSSVYDHYSGDETNTSCVSTEMIFQQNCSVKCDQSDKTDINCDLTENEILKSEINVRDVLLSSVTFLNHAEELFDTTSGQPVVLDISSLHDDEEADVKLILDCANELMECKCQQWELSVHPLLRHSMMRSKISISFEHLMGRICDEIENLKAFSGLCAENLLHDSHYSLSKRDLWFYGTVAGEWDLGWTHGFTWEEVEQVIVGIEELLTERAAAAAAKKVHLQGVKFCFDKAEVAITPPLQSATAKKSSTRSRPALHSTSGSSQHRSNNTNNRFLDDLSRFLNFSIGYRTVKDDGHDHGRPKKFTVF